MKDEKHSAFIIRWARARGLDPVLVRDAVKRSTDLKIVIDLSNNDKHGSRPRDGGRSGVSPRLTELERWLRLTTRGRSWIVYGVFNWTGRNWSSHRGWICDSGHYGHDCRFPGNEPWRFGRRASARHRSVGSTLGTACHLTSRCSRRVARARHTTRNNRAPLAAERQGVRRRAASTPSAFHGHFREQSVRLT